MMNRKYKVWIAGHELNRCSFDNVEEEIGYCVRKVHLRKRLHFNLTKSIQLIYNQILLINININ